MAHVCTRLGRWFFQEYGAARRLDDANIVLLHDLLLDHRVWIPQVSRLRGLGRVLALDGPGHGCSDIPPPFTLDEHAQALEEALRGMGAERAVLIGQGWGAMVALRFAQRQTRHLAGMVLSGASAEPEAPLRKLSYRLRLAFMRRRQAPLWLVRMAVAPLFYGPRARRLRPALISEMHRALGMNPREGVIRAVQAVVERDSVADRLSEVTVPTLITCGRDDSAIAPCHGESLARGIPGSRLVWMACGHSPPQERPEDFAMAVVPFVRRILSTRSIHVVERATG